jgi:cytidyltransferase-like protein
VSRLGIFGGTFDPIHHGHLIVAEVLKEELQLSRVLFLPAGQPPHKIGRPITPIAHRLAMLQLALQGNPHFAISYVDVRRPGPCYTVDSLTLLRREYSDAELVFLMGEDSLHDLPTWHEPNRIAELALLGSLCALGSRLISRPYSLAYRQHAIGSYSSLYRSSRSQPATYGGVSLKDERSAIRFRSSSRNTSLGMDSTGRSKR